MIRKTRRVRCLFAGIVQGVGFRPYIYRMATNYSLGGFVCNIPEGVVAEVEGPAPQIEAFLSAVPKELPPAAALTALSNTDVSLLGETEFQIISSRAEGNKAVLISPDIAVCENCLKEFLDPEDRRYRYPFINCTDCGPRLTIIRDVPYDRGNTSMACFPLCPQCRAEYENPANRRFHAEPNACPSCGPKLWLTDENGTPFSDDFNDPIAKAIELLSKGKILAVKGLGGFHLAVDATDEEAVRRLRSRKYREEKPLAVMVRDLEAASKIAEIGDRERELLFSPQRPIVLCRKSGERRIAPSVAPGVPDQGIMLPYTPLHYLLLENTPPPLVMTSANQSDEPICIGNREALKRLKGIADAYLLHNRDILVRCDDSVATVTQGKTFMIRRSRGYAPKPILLLRSCPNVLASAPSTDIALHSQGNLASLSHPYRRHGHPGGRKFHRKASSSWNGSPV